MTEPSDHRRASRHLLALGMAMLLPSLGTSIANVALPALQTAFAAPFSAVQWVVLSYLLAVTSLIVGVGRLGDLVGRRRLLLAGSAVFALASLGASLAPGLWLLIIARAAQGLGAAIMMALSIALVSDLIPRQRAGTAMGLLGTISAVGTALGPSLGGALLAWASWPALFIAMAVAGIATFVLGLWLPPSTVAARRRAVPFDMPGMMLLSLSLGAYALSTTLGGTAPGLLNAGLGALALVALAGFVGVERRAAHPLIELGLLRSNGLSASLVALALVSAIMMATLVVGPFYLTDVLDLGPAQAGLVMSIGPGIAAVVGVPAGRLVDGWGAARITLTGLVGVSLGAVLMTALPAWAGLGGYVGALACITAGYALFQAANNTAIMASAPSANKGLTSALLGLARNLGLISGASAMGSVFGWGSGGLAFLGLAKGSASGLLLTFALASVLAGLALALAFSTLHRGKLALHRES